MTKQLDIKAVQVINEKLQNVDPGSLADDPHELYQLCIWCAAQKSFTGEQQSIAKKLWQDGKRQAYLNFDLSNEANKVKLDKYGVNVIKDFIAAQCGSLEATYEYVERTNNACGYMIDSARTVISSLKSERQTFNG
jgi:hypothetical protein